MSLINKVLRDLDARSTTRGSAMPKAVHRGLRPAAPGIRRKRSVWLIPGLTVVVAVFVYVGVSATLVPLPYSRTVLAAIGLNAKPEAVTVTAAPAANTESSSSAVPVAGKPVVATPVSKNNPAANKPATKPEKITAIKKPVAKKLPKKSTQKKQATVKRKPVTKRKRKLLSPPKIKAS